MEPLEQMDGKTYPPVGRCIYCGSTESLTDEHIIPVALNGTGILPKSSCVPCATITGAFEQRVLRGVLWPLRVATKMKSRSKHKDAPRSRLIEVTDAEGSNSTKEVGFGETPFTVTFPMLSKPGKDYVQGVQWKGGIAYTIGGSVDDLPAKHQARKVSWSETIDPVAFALMIAKVAYATAVAQGATFIGRPYVIPAILGETDDIGRWVITLPKPFETHTEHLHRVSFIGSQEPDLLVADVQLWSNYGTPHYGVILGRVPTR
jgi:hypothetical protein